LETAPSHPPIQPGNQELVCLVWMVLKPHFLSLYIYLEGKVGTGTKLKIQMKDIAKLAKWNPPYRSLNAGSLFSLNS
jgi:hypothetical protein